MKLGLLGRAGMLALLYLLPSLTHAYAQSARSRVAVVRSELTDRLLRDANTRLRAELNSAGFEVVEVEHAPGDPRDEVESAGGGSAGFATVSISRARSGAAADVWISDHVTGKTVVRRLEVSVASNAAAVLAIRALELLRASLLEVVEPPRASEPTLTPAPDVLEWVEPALPEIKPGPRDLFANNTLAVSALGLLGSRGLSLAVGPSLRVAHGLGRHWFGRASLTGPLVGPEPARPEGHASVRQEFAVLDLGLLTGGRALAGYAFAGVGVFHLHAAGAAGTPYRATSDNTVSFMGNAGIGALARLGARTALSTELGLSLLAPHPVVMIAGKDAGTAGLPSFSLALGVLVGL